MKRKTEEKVKHALGKQDGKKAHHVHSLNLRRAANGGFIARHELADEDGNPAMDAGPPREHIIPDMDAAHAHLDEHMGDQPAAGEQEAAPPGAGAGAPPDAGQQIT